MIKADNHNKAYWYGWDDGRYREQCCLTENRRPAKLKAPAERLDRYKDTRAGWEARRHSGDLLRAS